ncbi:DNA-primase RepB domain-containing protein [Hydrogenophaga sp. IBVHS1]|uniref:DNA-primase RepB domain-containing protein n=1 Tax=unclassified Hydrogenophaga TaxID=2610897 RepID=UPI0015C4F030|nr:DNA-primase RepB domain-containing protein [Hydrogenophaga sp. IBVHS1]
MSNVLTPDITQANHFLDLLGADDAFTFQTFDDNGNRKDGRLARVFHGTLDQHLPKLSRLQQQGAGVFVMVNEGDGVIHADSATCRTTKNVVSVRALWVDLDGSPLQPVLDAHDPDIVVESSPNRWHAYWLTNDCARADFKLRQQQIAAKFKGDPKVCDLPRVMRLPGFWHQKSEPFMTRLVQLEAKK